MVRGDDVSDKEYYGVLKDIFEVVYPGGNRAFVFKCAWYDVQHHGRGYKVDDHGLITVNNKLSLKTDEVYVLESQVEQVFYVQDPKNQDWKFVVKTLPRDLYDMPVKDADQAIDVDASQQVDAIETECHRFMHANSDFQVDSLTTRNYVVEKEPSVVKMVKKAFEEVELDDGFINDGDIEYYDSTSDEEELFYESS